MTRPPMWSVPDLATHINKSEFFVRKACRQQRIVAVKVGRSWRISDNEVRRIETQGVAEPSPRLRRAS